MLCCVHKPNMFDVVDRTAAACLCSAQQSTVCLIAQVLLLLLLLPHKQAYCWPVAVHPLLLLLLLLLLPMHASTPVVVASWISCRKASTVLAVILVQIRDLSAAVVVSDSVAAAGEAVLNIVMFGLSCCCRKEQGAAVLGL